MSGSIRACSAESFACISGGAAFLKPIASMEIMGIGAVDGRSPPRAGIDADGLMPPSTAVVGRCASFADGVDDLRPPLLPFFGAMGSAPTVA